MITAAEALRLPCAQLDENQRGIVNKILTMLDEEIPKRMRRHGFEFDTNNTDPAAMFEVNLILENNGWTVQCQPLIEMPRFQGASPTHRGYKLTCIPSKEAIEAAKSLLQ